MRIPLRPSRLTIRRSRVRYIILHHTAEIYPAPGSKIDNSKYQLHDIFGNVLEKKHADTNYHYVIEKIKMEYVPLVCRPFVFLCEWDDIPKNINNYAIHVALMGSYDFKIPERRLYEVLAFRILNPFLKMYQLPISRIYMHNEVSDNKKLTCPGEFIEKDTIIAMVRKYVLK